MLRMCKTLQAITITKKKRSRGFEKVPFRRAPFPRKSARQILVPYERITGAIQAHLKAYSIVSLAVCSNAKYFSCRGAKKPPARQTRSSLIRKSRVTPYHTVSQADLHYGGLMNEIALYRSLRRRCTMQEWLYILATD